MDLYLMRHGLAVPREENSGTPDAERPLTEEGVRRTEQMAEALARLGVSCEWIYTSPLWRARQTAEIAAKALKVGERVENWAELGAGGSNEALLRRLQTSAERGRMKRVMLVGHEPQLSELVSLLLSGTQHLSIEFKKAGVCCLDVGPPLRWGKATLRWLVTPKHLCLLGQR